MYATMMNLPLFIYLTVCVSLLLSENLTRGLSLFSSRSLSAPLTNMDSFEGKLFVGGGNYIYVLDEDLNIIQSSCEISKPNCNGNKNINKLLLVNKNGDGLVVCSSGNNGTCEIRNISNIGNVISKSSTFVDSQEYLKVSSDVRRPVQALLTQNGDLTMAVTFGNDMEQTSGIYPDSISYNYPISTRSLHGFQIIGGIVSGGKKLQLDIKLPSMEDFLIYYKASFQSNWMTYFVTNQKKFVGEQNYVSKLVRICQNGTAFNSYADIVIQCTYDNVDYNLLQDAVLLNPINSRPYNRSSTIFVGAFTRGNDPEQPSGETVICASELKSMDNAIMTAKKNYALSCEDKDLTSEARYLPSFKQQLHCINEEDFLEDDFLCDEAIQTFVNVIGKSPFKMISNYKIPLEEGVVTTLHGTTYNDIHSALVLGTSTGNFLHVNMLKDLSIEEYERNTIEGLYPIRKIHAEDDNTLYVMTSQTIMKYSSTNCSEYLTCAETMAGRNPLCGWCVYKERASRTSDCSNATNHWLSSHGDCVSMSVQPLGISVTVSSNDSNINVTLIVKDIPVKEDGEIYICRFLDGFNVLSISNVVPVSKNTYICEIPELSAHTNATIELLVKMQTGATAVLSSSPFLVFDCGSYIRCVECVSANGANCRWCSQSATCAGPNTCLLQSISNPLTCPKLLDSRGQHFIPYRTATTVDFQAEHLIIDKDVVYTCRIPAKHIEVLADANASLVSCPLSILKTENEKKEEYRILVAYGPKNDTLAELNDPYQNFVTLYSCTELASDCSHCKALNKTRYSCACSETNRCFYSANSCDISKCPAPSITEVLPRDGPVQGGTRLTIFGTNLGKDIADVENVNIADVSCALSTDVDDYKVPESQDFETLPPARIVCTTLAVSDEWKGVISVTVNSTKSDSSVTFEYKKIRVTNLYPNFGPKSGGTKITLYGENLAVGNRQVTVILGHKSCLQPHISPTVPLESSVESVNFTVHCTVSSYHDIVNITKIVLKIDETVLFIPARDIWYRVVSDPAVESISPKKGFVSGGTKLTVEGNSLGNAHSSFVTVQYEDVVKMEMCEVTSSERTICKVPEAPRTVKDAVVGQIERNHTDSCVGCKDVTAALVFDGVRFIFTMTFFLDPLIHRLSGDGDTVTLDSNDLRLIIHGKYLNLAATTTDINITVGKEQCPVIKLSLESIECIPPTTRPRSGMSDVENPEVNVTIGNIFLTVGFLRYPEGEKTAILVIAISTASSAVLALVAVLGVIFMCRKYGQMKERIRYIERTKDEKEMTEVTRDSRYTSEDKEVYAEISEADMVRSNNEETEKEAYYYKPDGYLESRAYLKLNETVTAHNTEAGKIVIVPEKAVNHSPSSDYVNVCYYNPS